MPPPVTSYTPTAGWEKAADHPISYPQTLFGEINRDPRSRLIGIDSHIQI
jgi:hypothetical protein